jgi:hypothetical protein
MQTGAVKITVPGWHTERLPTNTCIKIGTRLLPPRCKRVSPIGWKRTIVLNK